MRAAVAPFKTTKQSYSVKKAYKVCEILQKHLLEIRQLCSKKNFKNSRKRREIKKMVVKNLKKC